MYMLCLLSCDNEENKAQIHTLWSQVSVPLHYSWYFSVYLLLLRKTWILWVFFCLVDLTDVYVKKIPKEYMVCHGIILFPCWIFILITCAGIRCLETSFILFSWDCCTNKWRKYTQRGIYGCHGCIVRLFVEKWLTTISLSLFYQLKPSSWIDTFINVKDLKA